MSKRSVQIVQILCYDRKAKLLKGTKQMGILYDQTFAERKANILSNIKINMELIESFKRGIERQPDMKQEYGETIEILNAEMKADVDELLKLKRFRLQYNLADDTPLDKERWDAQRKEGLHGG
jgi:hypothetical protein